MFLGGFQISNCKVGGRAGLYLSDIDIGEGAVSLLLLLRRMCRFGPRVGVRDCWRTNRDVLRSPNCRESPAQRPPRIFTIPDVAHACPMWLHIPYVKCTAEPSRLLLSPLPLSPGTTLCMQHPSGGFVQTGCLVNSSGRCNWTTSCPHCPKP